MWRDSTAEKASSFNQWWADVDGIQAHRSVPSNSPEPGWCRALPGHLGRALPRHPHRVEDKVNGAPT